MEKKYKLTSRAGACRQLFLLLISVLLSVTGIGKLAAMTFVPATATITSTTSTCQANGTITISNVMSGTSTITPYQVALVDGPGVIMPAPYYDLGTDGSYTFTGVQSGTFTVSIVDGDGTETLSTIVVAGNYKVPNYTLTPSLNPCSNGSQTGKITVTGLTGGSAPFRYSITSPAAYATTVTTGVFDNLPPGLTYETRVTDACENFQTRQVQIPNVAAPGLSDASIKYLDCAGNVQATFTASGNAPFTYTVTTGSTSSITTVGGTTVSFLFAPNSSYSVQLSDNCGGTTTKNVTTGSAPPLNVNIYGSASSGCMPGASTMGAFYLAVDGGIQPYQSVKLYMCGGMSQDLPIQGDGTYNQTVGNLSRPCMYTVVVIDKCGTVQTKMFDMTAPGDPNTVLDSYTQILCPEGNSTLLRLKLGLSFGPPYAPSLPFSYSLTNASTGVAVPGFPVTTNSNEQYPALAAGVYTFQASDACGTKTTLQSYTIGAYSSPTVSLSANYACVNAGQVRLVGINNNPLNPGFYQYKILAGPDRLYETNYDGVFSNLTSGGTYTFEFYEGCRAVTINVAVPPYQQPTFEVGTGAICPPATTATIQAFGLEPAGQVVGPYQYAIIAFGTTGTENGNIITRPPQTSDTFTNLPAGNYNVQGFDACNNSFEYLGKVGPLPAAIIAVPTGPYCINSLFRIRVKFPVFGATYTYYLDGSPILTTTSIVAKVLAKAGKYTVLVTVPGGCTALSTADFRLNLNGVLTVNSPVTACAGQGADLTAAVVTAGSDAGTFTYFQDAALSVPLDASTGPANAIIKAGTYYIKLTTPSNCTNSQPVTVFFAPSFAATLSSATTCSGQPATLIATGGTSYDFGSGIGSSNALPVSPANTTVYSVTAYNDSGCPSLPASGTVTTKPLPVLTVTNVACFGAAIYNVTFSATTGATVTASSGVLVGNTVTGVPAGQTLTLLATLPNSCTTIATVNSPDCSGQIASLGDKVFEDVNNNGQQDAGDQPFGGVTVTLISNGTVVATTTTKPDGTYSFTGLIPTVPYSVSFSTPVGYSASPANVGNDLTDSDAVNGLSQSVTLSAGENNTSIDAGFNLIGIYDVGIVKSVISTGPYFPGQTVTYRLTVTNNSNKPVYNVVVSDDLPNGSTLNSGAGFGANGPGSVSALVSGPVAASGGTTSLTLTLNLSSASSASTITNTAMIDRYTPTPDITGTPPTDTNPGNNTATATVSIGQLASLGNQTFIDTNDNGVQDIGEPVLGGVLITLIANGTVVTTTTSNPITGVYSFTGLIPGVVYSVSFTTPATYTATTYPGGVSPGITLAPGEDNPNIDAGFNVIGIYDVSIAKSIISTGPYYPGQTVTYRLTVTNNANKRVYNVTVADDLPPGTSFLTGTGFTPAGGNDVSGVISGPIAASGGTASLTLTLAISATYTASTVDNTATVSKFTATTDATGPTPTDTNPANNTATASVPVGKLASLGDFVWNDLDNNGQYETGEPGFAGVLVTLVVNGSAVATTTTNPDGGYSFTGLTPGVPYSVSFSTPMGYTASPALQGNSATDSNPVGGITAPVTLTSGENNTTIDAGFNLIGIYEVSIAKNIISNGPYYPGQSVTYRLTVINNANKPVYNVTVADDLPPGTSFLTGTGFAPAGGNDVSGVISGPIAASGGTASLTLTLAISASYTASTINNTATVSKFTATTDATGPTPTDTNPANNTATASVPVGRLASLGNFVWNDLNNNGQYDTGEPGFAGVLVTLVSNGTVVATTTTNPDGGYSFTGLTPGVPYSVSFSTPTGYTASPALQGNSATDSNPIGGITAPVILTSGENNDTIDAGFNLIGIYDVEIHKGTISNGPYYPGQTITYQLTVTNNSNKPVYNVAVLDNVPTGTSFVSGTGFSLAGSNDVSAVISGPIAASGGTASLTLTLAISPGYTASAVTNMAMVTKFTATTDVNGPTPTDTNPNNNTATATAPVGRLASLGDFVWNDLNNNGQYETGELGFDGLTVTLFNNGTVVTTTTTANGGLYSFTGLTPGVPYSVGFTAPTGYTASPSLQGNSATDSNPIGGVTAPVTLTSGENNTTIDAGFNLIGIYDVSIAKSVISSGPYYPGQSVTYRLTVTNNANKPVYNVTVADDLPPGTSFLTGTGFAPAGGNDVSGVISGPIAASGGTASLTLTLSISASYTASTINNTATVSKFTATTDATGPIPTDTNPANNTATASVPVGRLASLGDQTFIDTNGDGIQNNGEPALGGVTVTLVSNGTVVATTTTNPITGTYSFTGLTPGVPYSVSFTTPANYTATTYPGGITTPVTLSSGENNTTLDAGFQGLYDVTIAKTVVTAGPYLPGGLITYRITVTNSSAFPVYNVRVNDQLPASLSFVSGTGFTNAGSGSMSAIVSGPVAANGGTVSLMLTAQISPAFSGSSLANVAVISRFTSTTDADGPPAIDTNPGNNTAMATLPVSAFASLGNYVFADNDRDGTQSTGDTPIAGVIVTLIADGAVVATTVTSLSGLYSFTGLTPGVPYSVSFSAPANTSASVANQGGDDTRDSDAINGITAPVTLTSGENNTSLDAGFYYLRFNLSLAKEVVSFPMPLLPGSLIRYRIVVTNQGELTATNTQVTDTPPAGLSFSAANSPDFTSNGTAATAVVATLSPNQSATLTIAYTLVASTSAPLTNRAEITADSGDDINSTPGNSSTNPNEDDTATATIQPVQFAALGNFVWDDENGNGQQDTGEPGILGVTVSLVQNNSIIVTTTTNANGIYSFTGLTPGVAYQVQFGVPTGFSATIANTGPDATDSDRDPVTGRSQSVTMAGGETNNTLDAGFYRPASLGDQVFVDTDGDGIQNNGEMVLGGVTVTLVSNGSVVATTTTNPDGTYSFTGLVPGVPYSVSFTAPAGYTATTFPTGSSQSVTLASGQNNPTIDAGFYPLRPSFVISKRVSTGTARLGDVLVYTITVVNSGLVSGSAVVTDALGGNLSYVPNSATTSTGTYTSNTGIWTIASLPANGTATLTFSASVLAEGIAYNRASVGSQTATVCTSIPVQVCNGSGYAVRLSVAEGRSSYQWYRNGTGIVGAISSSYTATQAGSYSVATGGLVSSSACESGACCPFVIEEINLPSLTLTAVAPTCEGVTPQTNGKVLVTGAGTGTASSGLTYQYSTGGTGINPATARPIPANGIPGNGEIVSNAVGGTTYYVRVSAGALANGTVCSVDLTVTVPVANCACPAPICVPITVKKIKSVR